MPLNGDLICLIPLLAHVACGMFCCFLFVCFALNQHNECMHTTEKPGVKDVSEPNSGSILNRKGKPP